MNHEIAYLIGVVQSDGYIYTFKDKKHKKTYLRLVFNVSKSSLPMLKKVQTILKNYFNKKIKIHKRNNKNSYYLQASIKRCSEIFNILGIKKTGIPEWILSDINLFGGYLAGLIDGDGNICIKRPKYPQCRIKITDRIRRDDLKEKIQDFFGCSAHIYYERAYNVEFYVSKKNSEDIIKYVYPHLQLENKRKVLESYISKYLKKDSII